MEDNNLNTNVKHKSPLLTIVSCFFFGLLGVHRFYTGYIFIGFVQLFLSFSSVGLPISILWAFIDFSCIIFGKFKTKNNIEIKVKLNIIFKIFVLLLYAFVLLMVLVYNDIEKPQIPVDKHSIKKETFSGQWAFNVDEVEVRHVWVSKESKLDGAKVVIDGKTYALTRNLTDLEFLPYKYWKDGEKKYIEGYGEVCKDVLVEDKICKVSLLDTINYIDTLPAK